MIVKIEDIEIRGHEVKQSKKDGKPYMVIRFEDVTGRSHEILDRDMENEKFYVRGAVGNIYADLDIGPKFTKFTVSRFEATSQASQG